MKFENLVESFEERNSIFTVEGERKKVGDAHVRKIFSLLLRVDWLARSVCTGRWIIL